MQRFDEIELQSVPLIEDVAADDALLQPAARQEDGHTVRLFSRLLALLTDLSLFVALSLALSPLLTPAGGWIPMVALGGFVVMISYYYFVGSWLLWGRTVGGTIFDVRVVPEHDPAMSFKAASMRWAGLYLSLLTAGIGFAMAALPSRRSLADRMSATRCAT